MKIAMIGHKRIPSREGGIEIVVEELAKRMVMQQHQVEAYNRKGKKGICTIDYRVHDFSEKYYQGIRTITIPTLQKKSFNALVYSFFSSLRALIGGYDVIHYHAEGPAVMSLIPHVFRKKIMVTIHGLDWKRSKWGGFAQRYIKFGEKIAAKYANTVVVMSKSMQEYFLKEYQRDTVYIANGVNLPEVIEANVITLKYGLTKHSYLLFLARIVPEKGLHYLIEAYSKIKTDIRLVIAGAGSHTDDYVDKIKKMAGNDDRILMTGFVQGEEIKELYSNCCVYILPSDVEGMPLSLLEAMSYGCTCIISDIPENIELAGDNATSFIHGDVKDLRDKLSNLLEKQVREGVHFAIPDILTHKHDWNQICNLYLTEYHKLCEKSKKVKKKHVSETDSDKS
jgi:glycosyltransferase involved in cell wall biosynthesis